MRHTSRLLLSLSALGVAQVAEAQSFGLADTDRIAILHAVGAQIYVCRPEQDGELAWKFTEPVAALYDQARSTGRHYAGPTWELANGAIVRAKVVAQAPPAAAGDIPHLMLAVTSANGEGIGTAKAVLRINTRGGTPPAGCSEPGALLSVPYAADYAFYANGSQD